MTLFKSFQCSLPKLNKQKQVENTKLAPLAHIQIVVVDGFEGLD